MTIELLVGADPELFVTREGKAVSAHDLIPGTKAEPFPVKDGAVQVDGTALEFNINPVRDRTSFIANVESVLGQLRSMVPSDLDFSFVPEVAYDPDYLKSLPREATELGCSPDLCAYTLQRNGSPDAERPFRTASGHLHFGWTSGEDPSDPFHIEQCALFVRNLDWTVGIISTLFEEPSSRRSLYGKAGAMRVKPYGVEYRTLSNFWLNNKELMGWVFDASVWTFNELVAGRSQKELGGSLNEDFIRDVINTPMVHDEPYLWNPEHIIKHLKGLEKRGFPAPNLELMHPKIKERLEAGKKKKPEEKVVDWWIAAPSDRLRVEVEHVLSEVFPERVVRVTVR